MNQTGNFLVRWDKSANVVDKYTTSQSFNIKASSGTVAFACRVGQTGPSRTNDRVEWNLSEMDGALATVQMCQYINDIAYCETGGHNEFPSANGLDVTVTMGFEDARDVILLGIAFSYDGIMDGYTAYVPSSDYPALGSMAFSFSSDIEPRPVITNLKLATSTTLIVSLSVCINDEDWAEMFYSLTKANPATTTVKVRPSEENAFCKGARHSKGLANGFTFVVQSIGVSAQVLAEAFATAAAGPEGLAMGITASGLVAGSQGALFAGLPASILPGPGVIALGEISKGAVGRLNGGLSGGAITGIVIGSVGGAVIILGVAGIVVAAVVVVAVVAARRDTKSVSQKSTERGIPVTERKGLRHTIFGIFGGVDMMNNPEKDHQSITGRSPPIRCQ